MEDQTWLSTFQELLHHYLPPVQNTPHVNVGSLVALAIGLLLVFRSARFSRAAVSVFALVLGAGLAHRLSLFVGTPAPITAAIGGLVLTVIAYRTYRVWLAVGSVLVLFGLAVVFQLGRGNLQAYLPPADQVGGAIEAGTIELPATAEEQLRNLHPSRSDQLAKVKGRIITELKSLGPTGWILPVGAALIGGLLAFWALTVFAVVWMSFFGALLSVLAATTFLCAHWPKVQTTMIAEPKIVAGTMIGLWLLGLIYQAKEARLPRKKKGAKSGKEAPKT